MLYLVTWLKAGEVIAEDEFVDLATAQDHFFKHRADFQAIGATGGRVWSDRTTYFQFDWNGARRSPD